jgi:hypothetical protein
MKILRYDFVSLETIIRTTVAAFHQSKNLYPNDFVKVLRPMMMGRHAAEKNIFTHKNVGFFVTCLTA